MLFRSTNQTSYYSSISNSQIKTSLINNFIKFAEGNKLVNSVNNTDESSSLVEARMPSNSWIPASEYEVTPASISIDPLEYSVPNIYSDEEGVNNVKTGPLGVSYISSTGSVDKSLPKELIGSFDPITSCKRFGGSNCEDLYSNVDDRCVPELNKSI